MIGQPLARAHALALNRCETAVVYERRDLGPPKRGRKVSGGFSAFSFPLNFNFFFYFSFYFTFYFTFYFYFRPDYSRTAPGLVRDSDGGV